MAMDKYLKLVEFISICILFSSSRIPFIQAAPKGSLITKIPGFSGKFPSNHYSGDPAKDAVVLWLNGGPCCSSLDGFVYEHGPFNFEQGKVKGSLPTLHLNPYSWSKVSNIIYLDSPCGVGFSYSTNTSKYKTDDSQTAADTHTFLLNWFELYPEFARNPFYIAGESYAGVYVPTLAAQVVKGNKAGQKPIINFKGYLVGNGVSNSDFDGFDALLSFTHGMGIISDDIYQEIQSNCKGNYYSPTTTCETSYDKFDRCMSGLNIYDILEPCYHDPESQRHGNINSSLPESFQELGKTEKPLKVRKRMFGRAWPLWKLDKNGSLPLWPDLALQGLVPCFNDQVATGWLNHEPVRAALHAHPKSVAGAWELCTNKVTYTKTAGNMIPYHKSLISQGYRALIYSGDHDMCVPFTGTEAWTKSLGYKIIDEWRQWISDDQVAGYLQGYDKNLTFLTIKGAGHTVPEYKPRESLYFYTRWLDGKPI